MVAYSFKKRFVGPIEVGLGRDLTEPVPVFPRPKLQTIRADRKRHARPTEILQLYYGMRTTKCRLIGVAKCVDTERVIIWPKDGAIMRSGKILGHRQTNAFAQDDGFEGTFDMMAFWQEENPDVVKFEGVLILWAPITGEP